ncbi:dynamin family protein [Microbispora hainanensis]|uniref:Dynamin family protein n=1 Tax=Microbispora hainanensis TaxID=568844 RepID=A0ABZ1SJB7_9ACTN|nr:dynamin family protein [Microbispora hainanensis]
MVQATRHPLADEVTLVVAAVADTAREVGDIDSATILMQDCSMAQLPGSTVVVVGEKNRGKSSLINALVGRRELLPVDTDISTRVHVAVIHADEDQAVVYGSAFPDGKKIEPAELPEYVDETAAVDPKTGQDRHPGVERVELGVASPLLSEGLVLVDTPGVGGLIAGHADITLATLNRADALIFVVNGTGELHASELAFLERATERIHTVLFVLTGIDKAHDGWRAVLAENHRLLRGSRFATAPWYPVSSRTKQEADRAAAQGRDERAAVLMERSGFAPLLAELRDNVMLRIMADRLKAVLGSADAIIATLDEQLELRLRSLGLDPGLAAAVRARQAELAELRGRGAQWRTELGEGFRKLESTLRRELEEGLSRLGDQARQAIDSGGRESLKDVPRSLEDGIRGLVLDLQGGVHSGAERLVGELAGRFGVHGVYVPRAEILLDRWDSTYRGTGPGGPIDWPAPVAGAARGALSAEQIKEKLTEWAPTVGSVGGVFTGIGSRVGKMSKYGKLGLALGVVAGVGAAIAGLFITRITKTKEELRRMTSDALFRARETLPSALQDMLTGVLQEVEAAVTERISVREAELEEALARSERDREAAEIEREAPRAEARAQRENLAQLRTRIADLRRRLTSDGV